MRGADIIITDEPTAVLTPQEAERLFEILNNLKQDGKSLVFISHKLNRGYGNIGPHLCDASGQYIWALLIGRGNFSAGSDQTNDRT